MAVVVNLDALRRVFEIEQLGKLAPQLRLAAALGQPPVEFLARIAHRLFEQPAAVAALRHAAPRLSVRPLPQCLAEPRAFVDVAVAAARLPRRHPSTNLKPKTHN